MIKKSEFEQILGTILQPESFNINGRDYSGWTARNAPFHSYESILLKNWRLFYAENIRLFAGIPELAQDNYINPILIIPSLPTIDILCYSKTGTHNNDPKNWKVVKQALSQIFNLSPFEIQFADQAGLHASFITTPSNDDSNTIEGLIQKFNPEAYDVMNETGISKYIQETGRFKLWWD